MLRLALLVGILLAARAPAEEWSRPYNGFLPGCEPANVSATLVRDARAGKPLAGVLVRQFEEYAGDDFVAATLLAEARTDEFGLVLFAWSDEPRDCHWVFDHPGYAVEEDYGSAAGRVQELAPGRSVTCQLLGPRGRPRADVGVEVFLGCGHGPAVRYATTDGEGRFVLRDIDPGSAKLWFVEPGLRSTYWEPGDGGERVQRWWAHPARTLHGILVDRHGLPVANAVVRSHQQFRGPAAVTDTRGRFYLVGWDPDEEISVHGPGASGSAWLGRGGLDPDRTVQIVLHEESGWSGRADREEDDIEVRIAVADAATGQPVTGVEVSLVRPEDGHVFWGTTGDGNDAPRGVAVVEAPVGRHLLRVGGIFAGHVAGSQPFDVRPGETSVRTVKAQRQPALVVEGLAGTQASVELVIGDSVAALDGTLHLPAQATAHVRVETEGLVRLFDVGPEVDGTRRAVIKWPRRKQVRVTLPNDCAGRLPGVWHTAWDGACLETHASGRTILAVDHETLGTQELEIVLPDEPGAVLDLGTPALRAPAEIALLLPDGSPADGAEIRVRDAHRAARVETTPSWHFREGSVVHVARDGFVTLRRVLRGSGPYVVQWGGASLDVRCSVPRFTAYVDGELFEADEGRLGMRGLDGGPHLLIVGAKGHEGRAMRLELDADEHRSVEVPLDERSGR